MYPTEFLNSITLASLPPHRLYLKKYASIILLRSLDPTQGMCNGSRLTIIEISSNVIDAEIATGTHFGNRVFIPRIVMIPSERDFLFFLRRKQFPIRSAFCNTITKDKDRVWNRLVYFCLLQMLYLVMAVVCSTKQSKESSRLESNGMWRNSLCLWRSLGTECSV